MPRTSLRLVLPLLILAGFHSGAMACNYPPVAVISGTDPVWLHVGHEWCFNGSNSYDPDGWIALWLWNWDDGSSSSGSGTPPLCVYHAWSEVDEYDPFLYVRDNLGAGDYEWMDVYVAAMGWSIPSPFIPVNDDDDDENGRMDRYNDGPVPGGDDDLMPWQISVNAPTDGDEVTLGLSHHYCLRVWDEPTREGLFIDVADHSETWAAGNWSRTVYVEGVSPSGESNRPMLTWYYFGDGYFSLQGWNGEPPSQIEPYVVHVDMDMQAVEDDFAEDGGQFTEETTPGGFIPLDECEELTIRAVKPFVTGIPNWAEITLDVMYYGAGRIRVWADQNKTQEITLPHTFEPPAYTAHTVYVEGYQTSSDPCDTVLTLTHNVSGIGDGINLTVIEVGGTPQSGPVGTVVTLSLSPAGTRLLSADTTVDVVGQYVPQGHSATTETTINYPAGKVHYDPLYPDEVKIVVGDVQPDAYWMASNPQIYLADSGLLTGDVILYMGDVTCPKATEFQLYPETELGTLEGTTFTPVGLIASGQKLVAQVLLKDDGLGSAPASLTLTLQSYDAAGAKVSAAPTEDYAAPALTMVLNKTAIGGIPGFHTYRSSPDAPIVPWAFELPPGMTISDNQYMYIVGDGSVRFEY